jgi:hypothetical protein
MIITIVKYKTVRIIVNLFMRNGVTGKGKVVPVLN